MLDRFLKKITRNLNKVEAIGAVNDLTVFSYVILMFIVATLCLLKVNIFIIIIAGVVGGYGVYKFARYCRRWIYDNYFSLRP